MCSGTDSLVYWSVLFSELVSLNLEYSVLLLLGFGYTFGGPHCMLGPLICMNLAESSGL